MAVESVASAAGVVSSVGSAAVSSEVAKAAVSSVGSAGVAVSSEVWASVDEAPRSVSDE